MSEGIITTSKNAINCVMNNWMLKDLKAKNNPVIKGLNLEISYF
jgi:hypothetical protein